MVIRNPVLEKMEQERAEEERKSTSFGVLLLGALITAIVAFEFALIITG